MGGIEQVPRDEVDFDGAAWSPCHPCINLRVGWQRPSHADARCGKPPRPIASGMRQVECGLHAGAMGRVEAGIHVGVERVEG